MLRARSFLLAAVASVALLGSGTTRAGITLTAQPNAGDVLELKFKGFTTENSGVSLGNSNGFETTWGIGSVTDLFNLTQGGSPIWVGSGGNPQGQSLDFILYGIEDDSQSGSGPIRLNNSGCTAGAGNGGALAGCDGKIHIDFYTETGSDPALANSTTPSKRTGFGSVTGISDVGTKYMSWVLTPGDIDNTGDHKTTLVQDVDQNTLPTDGSGKFLADCVTGPGCALFGKNDEDLNALSGLFGDFLGSFTLQTPSQNGFPGSSTFPNGFAGLTEDPVLAVAAGPVPEPGSLVLVGTGLLGLFGIGVGIRRKRK
jgi:hypothetical protein